jgi:gliding motility-associated-like protein
VLTVYNEIVVNAGIDNTIISGTVTALNATVSGGTGVFSYTWVPGDLLLNSADMKSSTIPLNRETVFTLTAFDAVSGCKASDDVKISMDDVERPIARDDYDTTDLNTPTMVIVKANDSDPVGLGLTVSISARPKKGTAILNDNGTITYTPNTSSTGNDTLTYTICDKGVPSKCSSARLIITIFPVRPEFDAFEVFNLVTPNGDGQNDYWHIGGIEAFPDNSITLFNRWGDKVAEYKGYNNTSNHWDGTNEKGNMLPSGTYFYIINIPNFGSRTGWLMLQGNEQ